MRWFESPRPHKDPASIFGFLVLAGIVFNVVGAIADALDIVDLVGDYGPEVGEFLDKVLGNILLLAIAIVAISYSNRRYGGSVRHPQPRGERARNQRENDAIAQEYRWMLQRESPNLLRFHYDAVINRRGGINWEGLREPDNLHLKFGITITNASLRSIDPESMSVSGLIRAEGKNLSEVKATMSKRTTIRHTSKGRARRHSGPGYRSTSFYRNSAVHQNPGRAEHGFQPWRAVVRG